MNKIYGALGLAAFALAACSEDDGVSALTNNPQPIANASSSSAIVPSSSFVVPESSSSLADAPSSSATVESSSSSFGLSSSDVVSSSSLARSSSSSLFESSSSSESCSVRNWEQLGGKYPYVEAEFCESSWPEGVIPDGEWRIVEIDSSCAYCVDYFSGVPVSGNSSVIWGGRESGNDKVSTSTIEVCEGVCGTAVLEKGTLTFNPFVSIGFTFARDGSGNPVPVDVSNWEGICINYSSDVAPSLELDLGDSLSAAFNYARPAVAMSKSTHTQRKCFTWDKFNFPSWFKGEAEGWRENTGVMASKRLVGVLFKMQAWKGEFDFRIGALSSYDGTTFAYDFYK